MGRTGREEGFGGEEERGEGGRTGVGVARSCMRRK